MVEEFLPVGGQAEKIRFLGDNSRLAAAIGTDLRPVFFDADVFGQETLVRNAVPAFVLALVDIALGEELLKELLDAPFMEFHRRPDEKIRLAIQGLPEVVKADDDLVRPGPRVEAAFGGRFFHFLAVLVRSGEEKDLPAAHLHVSGQGVGDDRRVGVADVGHVIDVIDGRRDVERRLRFLFHWTDLRG
jgi:hypothetical protein